MITRRLFVLMGAGVGISAASAVAADPRDAVDRGQRLDTDALRDDVRTNRLQIPSQPLVVEPTQQPVPNSKGKNKPRMSSGSSR
jgi:hypothetical protein